MTNEELASFKIGMANELTDCVGDHIKLMGVILRLRDEAAELRHHGPEPYVRPAPEPAMNGQSLAERPGYVLKDDHAAPEGLPIAGARPEDKPDLSAKLSDRPPTIYDPDTGKDTYLHSDGAYHTEPEVDRNKGATE